MNPDVRRDILLFAVAVALWVAVLWGFNITA